MFGTVERGWGACPRSALSVLILICLCGTTNGALQEAPKAKDEGPHHSLRHPESGTMHALEGEKRAAALRIIGGEHEKG